jgi:transposase-like protein
VLRHMAIHISPEQRAKIISSIKDEGMSIADAAKTHLVTEQTIRKWLRLQTRNAHTSSTEVGRLKEENRVLKELIGDIVLRHRLNKKSAVIGT